MKLIPNKLRQTVLRMVHSNGSGHIGGSFSIAEVVAYLYSNFDLAISSGDKFVLSKGHSVPIIYAALYELGLLDDDELAKFRQIDSPLQGHPHKLALPHLIHASTGSLGQGLSIAIGHALGMRMRGLNYRSFCIMGDGEVQEGQVWEAFMLAPRHRLGNLTCFIDRNGGQGDGAVSKILDLGDLHAKVKAFGWNTLTIDGHDLDEIDTAIHSDVWETPTCIILNTVKGKGVSFIEGGWHARVPTDEEYYLALEELNCEGHDGGPKL